MSICSQLANAGAQSEAGTEVVGSDTMFTLLSKRIQYFLFTANFAYHHARRLSFT
jgi:ribosomal protein S4